jgi:hypothetical protein
MGTRARAQRDGRIGGMRRQPLREMGFRVRITVISGAIPDKERLCAIRTGT